MEKTVFYAGSFDPFTLGHLAIVAEAADHFNKIIIAVRANGSDKTDVSACRRMETVRLSLEDFKRIRRFASVPTMQGHEFDSFARLYEKMTAVDNLIELTTCNDEPIVAAIAAKADALIINPSENILCSPYVRKISKHYGHPLEIWHRTPENALLSCYGHCAPVAVIKELYSLGLFTIAAEYVAPSVLATMAVPYLENIWLKEKALYGNAHDNYLKLVEAYNAPERFYHNMGHLACMFDWLQVYAVRNGEEFDRRNLSLAVFAHDLVNTGGADDIARSLKLAEDCFSHIDKPDAVCQIATATDHRDEPDEKASLEEKLIHDIDLAALGENSVLYWQNAVNVRNEYAAVNDREYAEGRTEFLQMLLGREHIFSLPFFQTLLEENARRNIRSEVAYWQNR